MTDVLFYHLEKAPLDHVLPDLLEKSLQKGWRAIVQAPSNERIDALNMMLWTYRDESFLPHGSADDGASESQPIYLTTTDDNPNGAQIRFFIDGAECEDLASYERIVFLFNGLDEMGVAHARTQWKKIKAQGHDVTYWRQNAQGRWEEKA